MNARLLSVSKRRACAVALTAILGVSGLFPSRAPAQLLPPVGSLIVTITAPSSGSTVSGTTPVRASVSVVGALVVGGVQFKLDGANLGTEDTSAPYSVNWDTRTASNGSHTLTAVARDALLGLQFTSNPVTVTVFNDTTPPAVSITSPASGSSVTGTITINASASDNVGVAGVQFFVDGVARGAEDTTAPYSVSWDTSTVANGSHTLSARARDAAGNTATSAPVTVAVFNDNSPPTVSITSPTSGATVFGTVTINASASDNVGVAAVQFFVDGTLLGSDDTTAPYSVSWDTTAVANGSHTLSARARDAVGNIATSATVAVTVANGPPPDTTPPTATITSPGSGATVSGTVAVTASASDNVGVAGVQFKLDGVNLGAEDTTAPYSVSWDTTSATNGSHSLTAVARDAAGNTATSAPITVSVSNAAPPPPTTTRVEDTDASVTYSGAWISGNTTRAFSGGSASFSRGPSAQASITFTGTRVSWISWRSPQAGIARVILDGAQVAQVDLFASAEEVQAVVFTSGVLASGSHTLAIEATGTANASATDTIVVVDAFDVTTSGSSPPPPPPPGTVTRHEETDPAIVYSPGAWLPETTMPWSGGSAVYAVGAGPTATFTFTGTSVSWIGYRGRYGGIVQVFVDGALAAELDTYSATDEVSVPVYKASGLAAGSHTFKIELTGRNNPAALNSETAVDAFDVTP